MIALLRNWNTLRVIRLVAGISFIVYGQSIMDWLIIMIGIVLGFMAITNSGCNPFTSSCKVDVNKEHGV